MLLPCCFPVTRCMPLKSRRPRPRAGQSNTNRHTQFATVVVRIDASNRSLIRNDYSRQSDVSDHSGISSCCAAEDVEPTPPPGLPLLVAQERWAAAVPLLGSSSGADSVQSEPARSAHHDAQHSEGQLSGDVGVCFGGSWHDSDSDGGRCSEEDAPDSNGDEPDTSDAVRAQEEERFQWLSRYWSVADQRFNEQLLQTANTEFPLGTAGPIPCIDW